MKYYEVTGRWQNIHEGTLELAPGQAERFGDKVKLLGDGSTAVVKRYRVVQPVHIDRGEAFGYDKPIGGFNSKMLKAVTLPAPEPEQSRPADNDPPKDKGGKADEDDDTTEDGDDGDTPLEDRHWTEIKKLVEAAGGEWVNKHDGIAFLRGEQDESQEDDDTTEDGD